MSPLAVADNMDCPECGEVFGAPSPEMKWEQGMPGYLETIKAHLEDARARRRTARSKNEKAAIRGEIEDLGDELKNEREYLADEKREKREDEKNRIYDLHRAMGAEGYWGEFIKRPTQAQVKKCMEELDQTKPEWDEETCGDLLDLLLERYPDLQK